MKKFYWQTKNNTSASAMDAAASRAQNFCAEENTIIMLDAVILASLFVICTVVSVISIRVMVWVLALVLLVGSQSLLTKNGK